jgi:hypothetical protein
VFRNLVLRKPLVARQNTNCSRACFIIAIIATVAYSVDNDMEDATKGSELDKSADEVLVSLPALQYPLPGEYSVLKHAWETHSRYRALFPFK